MPTFLPTPSARRATLSRAQLARQIAISTHALREEGDPLRPTVSAHHENFYPRPPRGGRRHDLADAALHVQFLPTPSARRATAGHPRGAGHTRISTHALREEGDRARPHKNSRSTNFYPRPPRGGRLQFCNTLAFQTVFLPTPSARRATRSFVKITSPLEFLPTPSARRATRAFETHRRPHGDFYPRPPRGGRPEDLPF